MTWKRREDEENVETVGREHQGNPKLSPHHSPCHVLAKVCLENTPILRFCGTNKHESHMTIRSCASGGCVRFWRSDFSNSSCCGLFEHGAGNYVKSLGSRKLECCTWREVLLRAHGFGPKFREVGEKMAEIGLHVEGQLFDRIICVHQSLYGSIKIFARVSLHAFEHEKTFVLTASSKCAFLIFASKPASFWFENLNDFYYWNNILIRINASCLTVDGMPWWLVSWWYANSTVAMKINRKPVQHVHSVY